MSNKHFLREYRTDFHGLVSFIPESKEPTNPRSTSSKPQAPNISGEEVKAYYETLINEPECSESKSVSSSESKSHNVRNQRKRKLYSKNNTKIKHTSPSQKAHTDMLRFAQNGDVQNLRKSIEAGVDLNFQDKFGWTALMCSAVEGHVCVVRLLLNEGVDITVVNNTNQTARDLAIKSKKMKIVDIFDNWNKNVKEKRKKVTEVELLYCQICQSEYSDKIKHESSTAHLFNRQLKPMEPYFAIPESNKGFQLMLKHGWNKSTGLGPQGQGSKYPVKTVLKRDRIGLGGESKQKSKVTHFEANDPCSIDEIKKNQERRISVRTLSKREARYREKKDKNWEREMRHYFNTD